MGKCVTLVESESSLQIVVAEKSRAYQDKFNDSSVGINFVCTYQAEHTRTE